MRHDPAELSVWVLELTAEQEVALGEALHVVEAAYQLLPDNEPCSAPAPKTTQCLSCTWFGPGAATGCYVEDRVPLVHGTAQDLLDCPLYGSPNNASAELSGSSLGAHSGEPARISMARSEGNGLPSNTTSQPNNDNSAEDNVR